MTVYINKKTGKKFNISIYYGDFHRIMLSVIAALSIIAIGLLVGIISLESQFKRVDIEAGESISAEKIAGEGASFGDDFDPGCVNHAGVYYFTVYRADGAERIRLSVKDTRAPEVVLKDVYFAIGGEMPTPIDFIESVNEPDDFGGEFLDELPDLKKPGEYTVRVRYYDVSGNQTEIFTVTMHNAYDRTPPEMELSPLIVCEVGESIAYKPYVALSDKFIGKLSFSVDESELDLSQAGEYTVYITGRDAIGNMTERQAVSVCVVDTYSEAKLNLLLDELVQEISPEGKSREKICREIYDTVRDLMVYTGDSPKGDVKRAAFRAIVGGGGDCYSYFALSKLLLEKCGIETLDVQRARGYTEDTHYWNLVNIGEEGKDEWYHFDATELKKDRYTHSGCLLTEKQIKAYSRARAYFYEYDKLGYPDVSEKIITPTPRLEELYK